ncbi:MAG: ATP synthase F1 subunit epsilon, partial [Spirochaetaceae bacterium]|nr:ATP synthase F1 subunit epsilon [Spirochaetaceae bacterium]
MAKRFILEVYTPYRLFYADTVEALTLTLRDGEIGIYADHDFITAPVVSCVIRIKDKEGLWKAAFVTEGILEVTHHKTVLLVDAAEWPDEIDQARALAAKREAEESLSAGRLLKFEIDKARDALKRADTRLRVYEMRG